MAEQDPFGVERRLETPGGEVRHYSLEELEKQQGFGGISKLPFSVKVLLEAALRQVDGEMITEEDVRSLAGWKPEQAGRTEIPFKPGRVVMQDFTGVPAVVDLAAMRDAMAELGGEADRINPVLPVDLVIDHSVQVDKYASSKALEHNAEREFQRNRERYEFLRWGADTFDNFRVVPPATGIVHQVNLEYLAQVVMRRGRDGTPMAYPDSLVGTDSHTTMINGLGVLGWGVGGIEAEAALLGQPIYMLMPEVVGVKLTGALPKGATATDLVLRVTEMLRQHGVVGKFVEFFGPGLGKLPLADRATIGNMSPEHGSTCAFFPVDDQTLTYMRSTARPDDLIKTVEAYSKAQGMFGDSDAHPEYSATLELDMSSIEPSVAGPKRPQDRIPIRETKSAFVRTLEGLLGESPLERSPEKSADPSRWLDNGGAPAEPRRVPKRAGLYDHHRVEAEIDGERVTLSHGSVVIAAITSCTNTSNPSVMIGAGMLAKNAVDLGLDVPPYVKTSLAPGSRVVTRYLQESELMPYLEGLGFHLVGYGCTTCIGNSGPLREEVSEAIRRGDLVATSVLSGNRNFEGRIHPEVKANYLASPPLVVAYALAGTMDVDFATEPVGHDRNGDPVYLDDLWPSQEEIAQVVNDALRPEMFEREYADVFEGNETWNRIDVPTGERYAWSDESTYIHRPPFFDGMGAEPEPVEPMRGARVLAKLGDSVTTDHISPAAAIPKNSPAGKYLMERGVEPREFNTFGSRRGNDEVMVRGTFGNIRIRNQLVPGVEGGYTKHLPTGEQLSIYDAAMRYQQEGTPLVVLAGKEYGSGSSRDWAAKGTLLLGVRAVLAESYERIHRSNLVGMGVLPLQFKDGDSADSLGLDGTEVLDVEGLEGDLEPVQELTVVARDPDSGGEKTRFSAVVRCDTAVEVDYYRHGGILKKVLRDMASA